jgi:hypothetical protein
MIQLDKKYTTRDGREVRIHAIDGPGIFPVITSINNRGTWGIFTFPADGKNQFTGQPSADLIEIPPLREFKIMTYDPHPAIGDTFTVTEMIPDRNSTAIRYTTTLTEVRK